MKTGRWSIQNVFAQNVLNLFALVSQGPFVASPALTLENLNHYLYAGRENFESNFRVGWSLTRTWQYFQKQLHLFVAILKVLVAGGGIGDSTLFLAEQLNHTNAQVLWLFQSIQAHKSIKNLHSHDVLQIHDVRFAV